MGVNLNCLNHILNKSGRMKKLLIVLLIVFALGVILFFVFGISNNMGSKIVTRQESDKVNIEYHLNKITKKADFKIEVFLDNINLSQKSGKETMIEGITEIYCTIYQAVFFDPNALEKFRELDPDFELPENSFIGDYKITRVIILLKNKETDEVASECEVTGPNKEDIKIEYK